MKKLRIKKEEKEQRYEEFEDVYNRNEKQNKKTLSVEKPCGIMSVKMFSLLVNREVYVRCNV